MLPYQQPGVITYSAYLASSYQHWTGHALTSAIGPEAIAYQLYHSPAVLLSHGMQDDPIFCYANLAAQELWNIGWDDFIRMPSRLSAQGDAQGERERLLLTAKEKGYIAHYQGVRVTSTGKQFSIRNCILWNVLDEQQNKIGQAANFNQWEFL